jgi:hypothetical protein
MDDNGNSGSNYLVPAIFVTGVAALFLMSRGGSAKKSDKSLITPDEKETTPVPIRPNEISVSEDAKESTVGTEWVPDVLLPYLRKQWSQREVERWGLNPAGFGYSGDATYWGWDYFFNPEEDGILEVKHDLRRALYANQAGKQRQIAALPSTPATVSLLKFIDNEVDGFVKSQIQRVHEQSWQQGS